MYWGSPREARLRIRPAVTRRGAGIRSGLEFRLPMLSRICLRFEIWNRVPGRPPLARYDLAGVGPEGPVTRARRSALPRTRHCLEGGGSQRDRGEGRDIVERALRFGGTLGTLCPGHPSVFVFSSFVILRFEVTQGVLCNSSGDLSFHGICAPGSAP